MKNIRFRDLFWIRISLLDDPAFAAGAPWRIAPWVYDRLEAAGLVEKRVTPRGTPYAVGTDLARAYVSKLAERSARAALSKASQEEGQTR